MAELSKPKGNSEQLDDDALETFADELDQYDLLGEEEVLPKTDLSSTARAFNQVIQRKQKEQEEKHGIAEREARQRHGMMLTALMKIRKSLRDVTRINLGERFEFELICDDHIGWPRLRIILRDAELAEVEYPTFEVTAHDRHSSGTVEIVYDDTRKPERINLTHPGDLKRMPSSLRTCVRKFLDMIGEIVLEAGSQDEFAEEGEYIAKKNITGFDQHEEQQQASRIEGDFFEEDAQERDFLDALPSLDDVDSLPELASGTHPSRDPEA